MANLKTSWGAACVARAGHRGHHEPSSCSPEMKRTHCSPGQWRCLHHRNIPETVAGVSASALIIHEHPRNQNRITCGGWSRTIDANIRPFVCNDCTTAYHRTCSGLSRDAANTVTNTGHRAYPRCLATAAPAPAQPLTRRLISEPKHHRCRQILRILQ